MRVASTGSDNPASVDNPQGLCGNDIFPEIVWIQRKYTLDHCIRVASYAEALAKYVGLPEQQVRLIRAGALLHDIGKVNISEDLLHKIGELTPEEYANIQNHCRYGHEFLLQFPDLARHGKVVRHHHERWDGKGYPDGLANREIPLASRIIHIADSIDVMLCPRSYKISLSLEKVLSEMEHCRGLQFDPELTDLAIEWLEAGGLSRCQTKRVA